LIAGLAEEIPDLQERVNHILTKQVFGIGITELTTLMARRTVYCSMTANGPYSICTEFDDEKGNIIFPNTEHTWDKDGRCEYCGANSDNYGGGTNRENYAYPFIHDNFEKEFKNMKFDVIIGNPPYQLNVGNEGGNKASSLAIYDFFVDKALDLNPTYITMIIPSRWMTASAKGITSEWIEKMINDKRIKEVHDFLNSEECFDNVAIRGGVNYFLWDKNYNGKCNFYQHSNGEVKYNSMYLNYKNSGIVIREKSAISILNKVIDTEGNYFLTSKSNFSSLVSPKALFTYNGVLDSSWKGFSKKKSESHNIKYYMSSHLNGVPFGWVQEKVVTKNKESMYNHKIYINAAGNNEKFGAVLGKPFYGEKNSVCSGTYLVIGYDSKKHNFSKDELFNIMSYIETKFFRFMVDIKKSTQNCARGVYQFVPLQDFSKPWTDAELYKKYKLTQEEIDYIEDNIDPMPTSDD